jgi:diguanylate cyclase (GGDEF)-like protein/PAS domain S-box-containing protein
MVAGCIALIGLDAWRTLQARGLVLSNDRTETTNLARSLAQHAHDMVAGVDVVLQGIQERLSMERGEPMLLSRVRAVMRQRVVDLPVLHSLFVFDAAGNPVVTSLPQNVSGRSVADRDYFQRQRDNPHLGALVSGPYRSKSDGSWVLCISRRLERPDGSFDGIVNATIEVGTINSFYATFDMGRQGVVALLTLDGTMIVRRPNMEAVIGSDVSSNEAFSIYLPQSPVGSYRYTSTLDHVERQASYRRVDGFPLVVVVAHAVDDVLAEWRHDGVVHLMVSTGVAIALAAAGFAVSRQVRERQVAEERYRLLADNSSDAIVCTAMDGRRLYMSPSFMTLTGWSYEECKRHRWGQFVHPDDRHLQADAIRRLLAGERVVSFAYRYVRPDESWVWVEARCHLVAAGEQTEAQFVGNIRDITQRKLAEEKLAALNRRLATQANTDGLTGLANRRRFDAVLAQECRRMAREQAPLSLILIDIDHFKCFNDAYGHPAGDRCLCAVAQTIARFTQRAADTSARYGGEEFVLLLPNTEAAGAFEIAERIRAAIQALAIEHACNDGFMVVTASLGVSTLRPQPGDGGQSAALLAQADIALYDAKRYGRNRVVMMPADCDAVAGYTAMAALTVTAG